MIFLKKYYGLLFVIFLSFWAVQPLFTSGFFPMHDDTQVARVFEIGKALKDGMFPVRWVADLGYGYGYPIFNFYAPLAYYVGGFFTVTGFDALSATKIMMGIGMLLSGVCMYLLARSLFDEIGGVVSALFYMYAPYHAVNLYVRGDISELYAYAFIPLVFYGLVKVYKQAKWRYVVLGSLGYAGIILSHNLTAMMVTPCIIIVALLYCYLAYKNKKLQTIYFVVSIIFFGVLLSAFYWLPALLEMRYTNVFSQIGEGGADFRNHFVCLQQLWSSEWGFGGSAPGCIDGMSFRLGKLYFFAVLLGIISLIVFIKRRDHYDNTYHYSEKMVVLLLSFVGFSFSILCMLAISLPLWEAIPLMAFFQYPWRFLLLASFFSSLLAGVAPLLIANMKPHRLYGIALWRASSLGLLLSLFYFNIKLFQPQTILQKNVSDYTNEIAIKWIASKISDEYMPKGFLKPISIDEIVRRKIFSKESDINIKNYTEKTQQINAIIEVSKDTSVTAAIAYFPSWAIYLDGKKIVYEPTSRGVVFSVPQGVHAVSVVFRQTLVAEIGNIISLGSIAMLITGIIILGRKSLT